MGGLSMKSVKNMMASSVGFCAPGHTNVCDFGGIIDQPRETESGAFGK